MTVLAWDGKTLAADRRTTDNGMVRTTTKIERAACGALLGGVGTSSVCRELRAWWMAGAHVKDYPSAGNDATLMVVRADGAVLLYYGPLPVRMEDPFTSIGSGCDFATAAMHLGKTAADSVAVACLFNSGCGNGVDALDLVPA